jgi:hypothetical protein
MADVPFGRCHFFWPIDQRFGCWPDTTAIAVPEQMATVRLGDFSPQIGFFASAAGSVGFAMFGSNRFLSCGADSTITPIFAGGMALLAASGLIRLPGARGGAAADGRRRSCRRQPFSSGLDCQLAVDPGDDRLSCPHFRAHRGLANSCGARVGRPVISEQDSCSHGSHFSSCLHWEDDAEQNFCTRQLLSSRNRRLRVAQALHVAQFNSQALSTPTDGCAEVVLRKVSAGFL